MSTLRVSPVPAVAPGLSATEDTLAPLLLPDLFLIPASGRSADACRRRSAVA
ncbi:hypothetical protein ACFQV4_22925 [Streptomyces thermocarboxydus]